ncbi:MAG: type II toxin-antitoxin system death-on-curing family toxin [Candidatus Saccharimonadales bacterium]
MFGSTPQVDLEMLIYIHDQIIESTGGAKGFHDVGLIESALARPHQSAFGNDIHEHMFDKAAAMLDSIAKNHGFKDGNKRTAMAAASFYLYLNGYLLSITNLEYEEFMLHVVNDKPVIAEIHEWLKEHSSPRSDLGLPL